MKICSHPQVMHAVCLITCSGRLPANVAPMPWTGARTDAPLLPIRKTFAAANSFLKTIFRYFWMLQIHMQVQVKMFYFFMLLLWTFGWFFLSSPLGMCFFLHVSLSLSISLRLLLNVSGMVRQIVFNGGVKAAFQLLNKAYPTRTQTEISQTYIRIRILNTLPWKETCEIHLQSELMTLLEKELFREKIQHFHEAIVTKKSTSGWPVSGNSTDKVW